MRIGQLIAGRYRLEQRLGAGGMGVVWRATDVELGRTVAIKQARTGPGAANERRLRREARIAAGVHHPGVVTLFDVVTDGPDYWLVMEYVPSRSLAEILEHDGSLPPQRAGRIGVQLAAALEAVHANGIVHRDIKPANVLIAEDGTAKLADFGISGSAWADVTITDSALVGGTPGYLAPEVAEGTEPTEASDVFSLGATLFAAVEGSSPFGSTTDNPYVLLRRAAAADVRAPEAAGELAPALTALLDADPANRPTAARARELLDSITPYDGTIPPAPRKRNRRARSVVLAVAGVAAVAVATSLIISLPGESPSEQGDARAGTIGDARTADPCALMNVASLNRFGDGVELDPHYGNFNRCQAIIATGTEDIDVRLELEPAPDLSELEAGGRAEQLGPVRVIREARDDDSCDRNLLLADRNMVSIVAEDDNAGAPLCQVADAATGTAVEVLRRGEVPRRAAPLPDDSLAHVDACTLLGADALDVVPGVNASEPDIGFGRWECDWHSTTSDMSVMLRFDQQQPPLNAEHGRRTELSGHKAFIEPEGDGEHTCIARVVGREYADADGKPAQELIFLVVSGDFPLHRLCGTATELGGAAAAGLPA